MEARRLADRFAEARARGFVGRRAEVERFRRILAEGQGAVVHVHGPAGIGKSTLLRQFGWLAARAGRPVVRVDAESGSGETGPGGLAPGTVVVVDLPAAVPAAERLLADVPDDTVLALADREPPPLAWRTDPAWQGLLHVLALAPLPPADSAELLARRGVPAAEHPRVLEFTHGHPLALALMADVHVHGARHTGQPAQPPWVVSTLLAALLEVVPSPLHRAALEAYAQVLVTTEPLLAALVGVPDARELFDWLCSLSVTEYGGRGIHPHDLARSVLDAELAWRHPVRRAELRRRAGSYYQQLFADHDRPRQRTVLADFAYLHRDSPLVGPLLAPVGAGPAGAARLDALTVAPTREAELPDLLAMAERHEGAESAALLRAWWAHPAATWGTVAAAGEGPSGFYVLLALDAAEPAGPADPAVVAARAWLRGPGGLRAGERALLVRCWLAGDAYQDVSPVQTLITLRLTHHYLSGPRPALTLLTFADPAFWAAGCAYADFERLPAADFTVGGRTYGAFVHDWRRTPPLAWLDLLGARESAAEPLAVAPPEAAPLRVLDREEFGAGVREALRGLGRAGGLHGCVLLRSRSVAARGGEHAGEEERAVALAALLREAAARLEAAPHDRRGYRALHHTYLRPAGTQQRAADLLRLPMSTYRRHLAAGVDRLTEELWRQELEA
ncbi:ATP-binding protein [Streptomyces sp. NRRL S-87]|uniref:ATP-binding protein n=1 Tax=Streptomyces sp. NRRL S-87 TaxID=1463920 RepID=UPI0004C099A6|nr:ATP-binding protein [Streptomyces sp. NRRL S-87]